MKLQLLPQIEKSIEALPYEEQLKLIERIVHRLRQKVPAINDQEQTEFERQLEKMAADLQIRTELQSINEEFAQTDALDYNRSICSKKRKHYEIKSSRT